MYTPAGANQPDQKQFASATGLIASLMLETYLLGQAMKQIRWISSAAVFAVAIGVAVPQAKAAEQKMLDRPAKAEVRQAMVLPAFPGAEGWGAAPVGGRGGKVIHVTNLKNAGPGSFREALETRGPRIIVFDVGGAIEVECMRKGRTLGEGLRIPTGNGHVTIAGQTAPGGITLIGGGIDFYAKDWKERGNPERPAGEVIMRHMRFRGVHNVTEYGEEGHSVSFWGGRKAIIDHCSGTGGMDEGFDLNFAELTCQWSTVEATAEFGQGGAQHNHGNHNKGFMSWGNDGGNVSLHHSLVANHMDRSPLMTMTPGPAECRNNVIYNGGGPVFYTPGGFNIVGNYWKQGVTHRALPGWGIPNKDKAGNPNNNKIYFRDNFIDTLSVQQATDDPAFTGPGFASHYQGAERLDAPVAVAFPGKTLSSMEAYELVLSQAGAWPRDATTRQQVKEVRTRTGQMGLFGPYEQFAAREDGPTSAKFDTDRDGMPDAWETAHGLDPKDPADGNRIVPKGASKDDRHAGYTYVEYYLNELADSIVGVDGPLCEVTTDVAGKGRICVVHSGRLKNWAPKDSLRDKPPRDVDWGRVQVFNKGSTVGLKAVPAEGQTFDHWSGGSIDGSKEPTVWLKVEANTKVVAHFAAK